MSSEDFSKKDEKKIEINTLFNPLSQGEKYQTSSNNENYEAEKLSLFKNRKERKEKEKEYNFKEKIIYNSLPTDYINQTKSDSTNTYYFEKFFEEKQDFDYLNYTNLINMRTNYLNSLFKKSNRSKSFDKIEEILGKEIKEEKEEKEEKEKKEEKEEKDEKDSNLAIKKKSLSGVLSNAFKKTFEKYAEKCEEEVKKEEKFDENEFKTKDGLYSLITDLSEMMNYPQGEGDQLLYYSIIERIFSNIFFEIETFFNNKDLAKHSLYEIKLCECIDLFEKNFFAKEENINNKTVHFLYQLQKISLYFQSCGAFLKILKLMKSKNIVFDNYSTICDKYFKYNISELIKEKKDKYELFKITLTKEISNYEFCVDDKYLYICYDKENKNYLKLEKYDISNGEKLFEKEIGHYYNCSLLNDIKNNKINILIYKLERNEFELFIINKSNLLIENKIVIPSPIEKAEYIQIITSLSYFYLISVKKIYILEITNTNQLLTFKDFLEMKRLYKKENSYYFILDDFIEFSSSCRFDLKNKIFADSYFKTNINERYYFDNFNNRM